MRTLLSFTLLLFTLNGCAYYQDHTAQRTEQLRRIYPAGMSREEVRAKWNNRGLKPDFSASRPTNGWGSYPNQYLGQAMKDLEAKSGKEIEIVDRYWGPDGWMSLCNCWYYFDSNSKLIDVEWQSKSD
jgi:hypothetical protein